MKNHLRSLLAAACIVASSLPVSAGADEHAGHHGGGAPSSAVASASAIPAKPTQPAASPGTAASSPVDVQMQAMQAMHEKMAHAGSMAERRALLGEQMKTMETGMAMMEEMDRAASSAAASGASGVSGMGMMGMGSRGMPAHHYTQMQRMEMTRMMMRMMVDRLAVEPAS